LCVVDAAVDQRPLQIVFKSDEKSGVGTPRGAVLGERGIKWLHSGNRIEVRESWEVVVNTLWRFVGYDLEGGFIRQKGSSDGGWLESSRDSLRMRKKMGGDLAGL